MAAVCALPRSKCCSATGVPFVADAAARHAKRRYQKAVRTALEQKMIGGPTVAPSSVLILEEDGIFEAHHI